MVDRRRRGRGPQPGTARTWNFNWLLPPVDGAYEVSAEAFDASGVSGTSRSVTITINRYPPSAPEDFFAGRNGSVVEVEWSPNSERDVIGYRVYRQAKNGPVELACPLTDPEVAECVDPSPPVGGPPAAAATGSSPSIAIRREPSARALRPCGPM